MDGTLLPDHSLSQRTIDAVRALRAAGVLFSLPAAARQSHVAGDRGLGHRLADGGLQWRHDGQSGWQFAGRALLAATAALTLALFSGEPDVEVWVFADGDWLRRSAGPMEPRKLLVWGMGREWSRVLSRTWIGSTRSSPPAATRQLLVELEAQLQPKVHGLAQVSFATDLPGCDGDEGQQG
jgi:hypothetical protein